MWAAKMFSALPRFALGQYMQAPVALFVFLAGYWWMEYREKYPHERDVR